MSDRSSASLYILRKDLPKALEVFGDDYYNITDDDDPRPFITVEYEALVNGGEDEANELADAGVMFILQSDACVGAYGEYLDVGLHGERFNTPSHSGHPCVVLYKEDELFQRDIDRATVYFRVWRHLIQGTEPEKAGEPPR